MGVITWEEAFKTLLAHIGIYDLGKQRWFDEGNYPMVKLYYSYKKGS